MSNVEILRVADLSYFNKVKDWSKVKSSVDAAIIRLGYRGCTTGKITYDEQFVNFINACKKFGIPYSIYFFPTSISLAEADEEGKFIVDAIKKYDLKLSLPVFIDSEVVKRDKTGRSDRQGKENRTRFHNRIFAKLKEANIPYGVYASTNWYKNNLVDKDLDAGCQRWVAQYASRCQYNGVYIMWQYTSKANVNGIDGNCDMSECYVPLYKIDSDSKEEENKVSAPTTNDIVESAMKWMENAAADKKHGYDQRYRWGEKGDYDCSSAVITAWQQAGVPVRTAGATYTGNMKHVFLNHGFVDVTGIVNLKTGEGLVRGDVLLNIVHHTAMYCGHGNEVEASINEKGTATGGVPGDQTGREFLVRSYRNYPWNCVLRYVGTKDASGRVTVDYVKPSKIVKFEGIVNTKRDPLNVRKGPGTEYGKCQTFGPLSKGTVISVCDITKDRYGAEWYYICYKGVKYGFVSASYIKIKD